MDRKSARCRRPREPAFRLSGRINCRYTWSGWTVGANPKDGGSPHRGKDGFGNGDRRLGSFQAIGAAVDRVVLDPNLKPVSCASVSRASGAEEQESRAAGPHARATIRAHKSTRKSSAAEFQPTAATRACLRSSTKSSRMPGPTGGAGRSRRWKRRIPRGCRNRLSGGLCRLHRRRIALNSFCALPNDFLARPSRHGNRVGVNKMKWPFVQRAGCRRGLPMPVRGLKRPGNKGRRLSFDVGRPRSADRDPLENPRR